MKFEEILPLLRQGKKAKHLRMKDGEYWVSGYASLLDSEKWPTLIKMYKNPFEPDVSAFSWGIERWAIMADDWEIVD